MPSHDPRFLAVDVRNIINDFVAGPKLYWINKFNEVIYIIHNYGPTLIWWIKLFNNTPVVDFWRNAIRDNSLQYENSEDQGFL